MPDLLISPTRGPVKIKPETTKYTHCPFCGSQDHGIRIFRCTACGEFFCECEGYAKSVRGWTYCPCCSNMEPAEDIFVGVVDSNAPDAD